MSTAELKKSGAEDKRIYAYGLRAKPLFAKTRDSLIDLVVELLSEATKDNVTSQRAELPSGKEHSTKKDRR